MRPQSGSLPGHPGKELFASGNEILNHKTVGQTSSRGFEDTRASSSVFVGLTKNPATCQRPPSKAELRSSMTAMSRRGCRFALPRMTRRPDAMLNYRHAKHRSTAHPQVKPAQRRHALGVVCTNPRQPHPNREGMIVKRNHAAGER